MCRSSSLKIWIPIAGFFGAGFLCGVMYVDFRRDNPQIVIAPPPALPDLIPEMVHTAPKGPFLDDPDPQATTQEFVWLAHQDRYDYKVLGFRGLANLALEAKQYQLAVEPYEVLIDLTEKMRVEIWQDRSRRAKAYEALGMIPQAIQDLEVAIKQSPTGKEQKLQDRIDLLKKKKD